jgi:MFS transporter, PPP family, 3-phenylpropionic acid transporter
VWIGVTLALYSLPVTALMPMYDAVALERLGAAQERYGRLRLFGSIGFVLAALGIGALVGRVGDGLIPMALVASQVLGFAAFLALPPLGAGGRGPAGHATFAIGLSRPLRWLLLIAFLQVAGYAAFNGFYTLYLRGVGYSAPAISAFWSLGVIAEIGLFAVAPMLLRRIAPVPLLKLALALTVVRWVLIAAVPHSVPAMVVAQVLHAAGFGAFQTVTVLLAARYLPAGAGGRAQALLAASGWGVGGIVGSVLAGVVWERIGPASAFAAGAVLSAIAWACASALPRTDESVTGARDPSGQAGQSAGRGP